MREMPRPAAFTGVPEVLSARVEFAVARFKGPAAGKVITADRSVTMRLFFKPDGDIYGSKR